MKALMRLFSKSPASSMKLTQRFTEVYEKNAWGDPESVSGWGSRKDSPSVHASLEALAYVVETYKVRSMVDIPCGDFNWMPGFLANHPVDYRGFDIVPALVEKNRTDNPGHSFEVLDVTSQVPPAADLIFCKDLFNHLSLPDVAQALANMKASGSRYLLASNNFGHQNAELSGEHGGETRHLDITAPPFNWTQTLWATNYLGLWDLKDVA